MSFILDALRKSEHERRMEAAPDIMHAPLAAPRQHLPMWAIVLMGGLAAALLGVVAFTLSERMSMQAAPPRVQSTREPVYVPEPAAPAAVNEAPADQPPEAIAPDSTDAADAAAAAAQARTLAQDSASAASPAPREPAAVEGAASPPEREPAIDTAGLPSYAAAVADGLNVGTLQMQLHVHSSVAANRFVVINGARRREGEVLPEGPRIEAIVPEGAVMNYQGRRFLLTPN